MSEGGWLISFNYKVSEPGEAVADDGPQKCEPGVSKRYRCYKNRQSEDSSAAMQQAIARMTMGAKVEGEKIVVAGELRFAHNVWL